MKFGRPRTPAAKQLALVFDSPPTAVLEAIDRTASETVHPPAQASRPRGPSAPISEAHVPAPTGKVTVRGFIVATKTTESDYGTAYKMTVKVMTPAGSWLAWGTIPQALFDEADKKLENVNGWIVALRGCEVEFTATLKRGRDEHFALFSRPTKARIVSVPPEKARQVRPWEVEGPSTETGEDPFAQFET